MSVFITYVCNRLWVTRVSPRPPFYSPRPRLVEIESRLSLKGVDQDKTRSRPKTIKILFEPFTSTSWVHS